MGSPTGSSNIDDVATCSDVIDRQVNVALGELLEGYALDWYRTLHLAQVWNFGGNSREGFDPLRIGRKRALHSRILEGEREKNSDDVRSGILTEMCLEHIKSHNHFNLAHLPTDDAVRSEIEQFIVSQQWRSNPDAMDIRVSMELKVFVAFVDM